MISEQEFLKIIEKIQSRMQGIAAIENVLNVVLYENEAIQDGDWLIDRLLQEITTDRGIDVVNEFLYSLEDYNEENPYVVTVQENEYTTKRYEITSAETLYNYLVENDGLRTSN